MNKGYLYAVGAYLAWGFLPIYWKALQGVPALEILSHRIVWSLVFLLLLLVYRRRVGRLRAVAQNRRVLLVLLLSACILALNWGTYIWAVNANRVVETSLGYFINPLVSVLLGVLFLRERLRAGQWAAVAVAALGVLYLALLYGRLPWVALVLALSFGFYGLIRKTAPVAALTGLTWETAWLFLPALAIILYWRGQGTGAFTGAGWQTSVLLMGSGLATAVPLLWFGLAARRITLVNIGILQYLAPTCQFLLGVFLYHEPFNYSQLVGFFLIWLALFLYTLDSLIHNRKRAPVANSPTS